MELKLVVDLDQILETAANRFVKHLVENDKRTSEDIDLLTKKPSVGFIPSMKGVLKNVVFDTFSSAFLARGPCPMDLSRINFDDYLNYWLKDNSLISNYLTNSQINSISSKKNIEALKLIFDEIHKHLNEETQRCNKSIYYVFMKDRRDYYDSSSC